MESDSAYNYLTILSDDESKHIELCAKASCSIDDLTIDEKKELKILDKKLGYPTNVFSAIFKDALTLIGFYGIEDIKREKNKVYLNSYDHYD